MATPVRRPADPVAAFVAARLGRTNFYQAVRLLLARPGGGAWPMDERIRFTGELSQAFPASEITGLMQEADGERCRIATPNYCVAGGLGPLPPAFADWMREQVRGGNDATTEFIDLFNHRVNATRYRIKEGRTPALNNLAPEKSMLGVRITALAGLGEHAEGGKDPAPGLKLRSLLGIAGLLTDCRRSGASLVRVLSRYLGAPVVLTPFVGAWHALEKSDLTELGKNNHALGRGTVLGRRVWNQQARVRLDVGPIDHALFRRLLPPGPDQTPDVLHQGFVALVRLLLHGRHDCEVRLAVKPQSVGRSVLTAAPRPVPAGTADNDAGLRLGETAWLRRPSETAQPVSEFLIPAHAPATAGGWA